MTAQALAKIHQCLRHHSTDWDSGKGKVCGLGFSMGNSCLSTLNDSKLIGGKSWPVTSLGKKESCRKLRNRHKEDYGIICAEHWAGEERQKTGPYPVLRLLPKKDWKIPLVFGTHPYKCVVWEWSSGKFATKNGQKSSKCFLEDSEFNLGPEANMFKRLLKERIKWCRILPKCSPQINYFSKYWWIIGWQLNQAMNFGVRQNTVPLPPL